MILSPCAKIRLPLDSNIKMPLPGNVRQRIFSRFDIRLDRWDKIISTITTKIANILQCYALGMGIKQISRSFELSCNTVCRYVRLFQEWGIPIKELVAMLSSRIQEMFSEGVGRNRFPS